MFKVKKALLKTFLLRSAIIIGIWVAINACIYITKNVNPYFTFFHVSIMLIGLYFSIQIMKKSFASKYEKRYIVK